MKNRTLILIIVIFNLIPLSIYAQWQKTILPLEDNEDLYGISFLNDQSFFICSNTQIAKTTNSGQTWQLVYNDTTFPPTFPFLTNTFQDLHFYSPTQGLATGVFNLTNDELVVGTLTGGNTWTLNYANAPFNFPVFFNDMDVNGPNVLVCGTHGHIIRSTNSGASFSTVNNTPDVELTEIKFVTATKAIAIGGGKVFISLNAGLTWSIDATFVSNWITSIAVPGDGSVYIMGNSALFKSLNNGATYTQLPISPSDMIEGSNLVANHDTLFIGSYVSVNGGKSWLQFKSIKNQIINKLSIQNGKVYALCSNKTLLVMDIAKAGSVDAAPIASFSAVVGDNCAGRVRQFNNTTTKSPDYTYKWWLNDSLVSTGYHLSIAFPNPGQTYNVMLTVNNGFATDTVKKQFQTVALGIFPKSKLTAPPVCAFNKVELRYDSVIAGFPYQLWRNDSLVIPEWWDAFGRSQPLISYQPTNNDPVTFVIKANFNDGCINTPFADTLRIVPVQGASALQITLDKPKLCPGDSTLIRISPTQVGNLYAIEGLFPRQQGNGGELVFRTGAVSDQINKFNITVTHSLAGCRSTREIPIDVHAAEASISPQYQTLTNKPIQLEDLSAYAAQWSWQFGTNANPSNSNMQHPVVTFIQPGYSTVQLIVTAAGGCKDTAYSEISVFSLGILSENEIKFSSEQSIKMPDFAAYFYYRITDTKADSQGNTYIVGRRSDTLTAFNRISEVGFIQKRNRVGQLLWEQYFIPNYQLLYGKEDIARCHVVEIDPKTGNVWVAGEFKSESLKIGDIKFDNLKWENHFVAKFNSEGKVLWVNLLFNENFGFKNEVRGPSDLVYAGCDQLYLMQYGHGGVIKRSGGLPDQSWGGNRSWESGSSWFLRFNESGNLMENHPIATGARGGALAHWGRWEQTPELPAYRGGPRMKLTPQGKLLFYGIAVQRAVIGNFVIDPNGKEFRDTSTLFVAVWDIKKSKWETAFPVGIIRVPGYFDALDKSIHSPGFGADLEGNIVLSFSLPTIYVIGQVSMILPNGTAIEANNHSLMFKFSPTGKLLWLNINGIQQIVGLDVLRDGSIIQVSNIKDYGGFQPQGSLPIAFSAKGSIDWIISKWAPDGRLNYVQNFGTTTYDQAYLLRPLGCGRYALLHSVNSDSTHNLGLVAQPRLAIFTLNDRCSDTLIPCMVSANNHLNTKPFSINLYPNPNTGNFTVNWEDADFKSNTIQVINTLKQVLYSQTISSGVSHFEVQTGGLSAGLYFLQVVSEGRVVAIEKFVKQ